MTTLSETPSNRTHRRIRRNPGVPPGRRANSLAAALAAACLLAVPLAPAPPAEADAATTSAPVTAQAATTRPATTRAAQLAEICDIYCDARDPASATGDRVPVTATIHGRTLRLHVSDPDVMGWGSIEGGQPGDEVWLDRSFDGGKTWASGSRLGATTVPGGSTGWRTQMYNVDDWNNTGVGALRACGKAGDRAEIACTAWARNDRNAWSRSTQAATALMMLWDRNTGLFETNGWWTGATALTAVIDNARISGMNSYRYAIAQTYDKNVNARDGQFRNEYLDDTGWWGLAWVAAYDLTGDSRYLSTARADADHMRAYWTSTCGGGVQWNTGIAYKNAITNELYVQLNAALHNRIPGDTAYLQRAQEGWDWFEASGMINSGNLVNDGLNDSCVNNGEPTWTYNQGVILGALAELHRATGDAALLETARDLADASTTSSYLNPGGILREVNEGDDCHSDGASFKGAYVRGLGKLNAYLADRPYGAYLDRQADAAYGNDRDALGMYGPHWAGPLVRPASGHGCQHGALDLLNAAEAG
ncbi:glycoside hydrolase family 76 protein [Promicromonospora sp. MEB111]|uniref:glycoside hydrolase family 76 protein n=1 Tax=Promicromonospora sp. MEB111 TaxID=3040301 RepID=UPI00254F241D|nr:glycoside hydrolase family 76 protein [Promicromonospora sp. MEB111]